jgi:hypothetical protein
MTETTEYDRRLLVESIQQYHSEQDSGVGGGLL